MPELIRELERLAAAWIEHANGMHAGDNFSRESGYASGLGICAKQLRDTLERFADDA